MRRLIFHIGLPKTGTSALQVFLAVNHQALLARGVDYFAISGFSRGAQGQISSGNGYALASSLRRTITKQAEADHAQQIVLETIAKSQCDTGLISSEFFAEANFVKFAAFVAQLKQQGIRCEAFYFVRQQEQILCSSYIQSVKRHGCTETPEDYITTLMAKNKRLHFDKLYRKLVPIFDPDGVKCAIYEDALRSEGGVFGAFARLLGTPAEGLDFATKDINNSLDPAKVAVLLMLNRYAPRGLLSDTIVANARDDGSAGSGRGHRFLSAEQSKAIEAFYAEENAVFAKRYFGTERLFQEDDSDRVIRTPIDLDRLDARAVAEVFGGLLVRYDQRLATLEHQIGRLLEKAK